MKRVHLVETVEQKPTKRNPYPPFTTSTLQQEASSRLGFAPARTMQIAQRLYEGVDVNGETVGVITYMRTDAVQMAPEGIDQARRAILSEFGANYVPEKPRFYQTKAKNAQEAHEAIRPTDMFLTPDKLRHLDPDQLRLYELIWRRTLASQMKSAEIERTTADIAVSGSTPSVTLRAIGSVVIFPGFLKLYGIVANDERENGEADERELPPLQVGDTPSLDKCEIGQHFTQPPPRYTEASLIRKMEELGIGRPSTYASTLTVLKDRNYVRLDKRALIPEDRGRVVTAFLESFFTKYVEYGFTADMEEELDRISAGNVAYKEVLRRFWTEFSAHVAEIKDLKISEILNALNDMLADHIFPPREDGSDPRRCPTCGTGTLSLKLGRYGGFIGCSNYPDCRYSAQLADSATGQTSEAPESEGDLGIDPESGETVYLKSGRFGPYVQLGTGRSAKRSSLPAQWDPETMTLEQALRLLSLPREVGPHPESGKPITAGLGRYGPFVQHDGKYANLPDFEDIFTVGLNRAVDLIAARTAGGTRQRRPTPATLRTLGEHPDGGEVTVRDGRYGPYVNHGRINATLPKSIKPEDVTLEKALELIAAKADAPAKGRRGRART